MDATDTRDALHTRKMNRHRRSRERVSAPPVRVRGIILNRIRIRISITI